MPPVDHSALRIRDGARAALPLAPAPFLFGLSFGVLADAAGMGLAAATVMSATTFAGSAQFAVATVFEDGGTASSGDVRCRPACAASSTCWLR